MIGKQGFARRMLAQHGARQKYDQGTRKIATAAAGISAIDPAIASPVGAVAITRALRSLANETAVRKRLLHNPKAAGLIAAKAVGTPYESYFKEIAEKAKAGRNKKHRMFVKAQSPKVQKILKMQEALRKADAEWAKKKKR